MIIAGGMEVNSFKTEAVYHIETSSLICKANQWTGFYMITVAVLKELMNFLKFA